MGSADIDLGDAGPGEGKREQQRKQMKDVAGSLKEVLPEGGVTLAKAVLYFNSLDNFTLVQSEDKKIFSNKNFKIVSKRQPSKSQLDNLIFAFNVCRYTKSNAIVLASNKSTIGIGSGQPSRLDSCEIAINKMNKYSSPLLTRTRVADERNKLHGADKRNVKAILDNEES